MRSWVKALEGKGQPSLLAGAVVWNRIDDAVRGGTHKLGALLNDLPATLFSLPPITFICRKCTTDN